MSSICNAEIVQSVSSSRALLTATAPKASTGWTVINASYVGIPTYGLSLSSYEIFALRGLPEYTAPVTAGNVTGAVSVTHPASLASFTFSNGSLVDQIPAGCSVGNGVVGCVVTKSIPYNIPSDHAALEQQFYDTLFCKNTGDTCWAPTSYDSAMSNFGDGANGKGYMDSLGIHLNQGTTELAVFRNEKQATPGSIQDLDNGLEERMNSKCRFESASGTNVRLYSFRTDYYYDAGNKTTTYFGMTTANAEDFIGWLQPQNPNYYLSNQSTATALGIDYSKYAPYIPYRIDEYTGINNVQWFNRLTSKWSDSGWAPERLDRGLISDFRADGRYWGYRTLRCDGYGSKRFYFPISNYIDASLSVVYPTTRQNNVRAERIFKYRK